MGLRTTPVIEKKEDIVDHQGIHENAPTDLLLDLNTGHDRMKQEILVLGLGAMGSSTCYHLAKRGFKVTGIDQFSAGHSKGSSHGQSRIIRKAYYEHPDYVPLLKRSYELWDMLSKESGKKLYHQTGIVYLGAEKSRLLGGILDSAKKYEIPVHKLSGNQLIEVEKRFRIPPGFKVLYEPDAGYLEVENSVRAHLDQAKKAGAKIILNQKVTSWKATASGVEVKTGKKTYTADRLVVTAGAWSGKILKKLNLPLRVLKKTMFWFPASDLYNATRGSPCFFYELPSGIFYGFPKSMQDPIGLKACEHTGGEEIKGPETLNPELDERDEIRIKEFVKENLPGCGFRPDSFQSCMYTMTPDEHFIIDLHPKHDNVVFGAGFSGHGFKFSSVIGEVLADLATEGTTKHPVEFLKIRN